MSDQTVFVEYRPGNVYREIARDARSPLGDDRETLERLCCVYSRSRRRIRMYADGMYIQGWKKRKDDPLFEAFDGGPTDDFKSLPSA